MADIRSVPGAPPPNLPAAPRGSARADAVRAAQAAFFQSALQNQTVAAAPVRAAPAAAVRPSPAPAPTARMAFDPQAPEPERILRPGSLVDLKV